MSRSLEVAEVEAPSVPLHQASGKDAPVILNSPPASKARHSQHGQVWWVQNVPGSSALR